MDFRSQDALYHYGDDVDHTIIGELSASVPSSPSSMNLFCMSPNLENLLGYPRSQPAPGLREEHCKDSMDTTYSIPNHDDANDQAYSFSPPPDVSPSDPFEGPSSRPWNGSADHTYSASHNTVPYPDCIADDNLGWTHEIAEAADAAHVVFDRENEELGAWNDMNVDRGTYELGSSLCHEGCTYTSMIMDTGEDRIIDHRDHFISGNGLGYTQETIYQQGYNMHTPVTELPPSISQSAVPPSPRGRQGHNTHTPVTEPPPSISLSAVPLSPSERLLRPPRDVSLDADYPRFSGGPSIELSANADEASGAPMDTKEDTPSIYDNGARGFNTSAQYPDSCFPASAHCPSPMFTNHPHLRFQSNDT
ncbi:hypothetical protein F5880DRAFT_1619692, partial [Lentinula raphanica]